MKKILAMILAVFTLLSVCTFVNAQQITDSKERSVFYVATDGNDANDGSIDHPFATVEKARDAIRAIKNDGTLKEGGAVVYIRGGKYLCQKGITFEKEDSGTENAPIVYRNYPGEEVIFTGAAELSADSFSKVTDTRVLERIVDAVARENVVEANLFDLGFKELPELSWPGAYSYSWGMQQIHGKTQPQAVAPELVINGKQMTIARYPNEGYMKVASVIIPGENVRMWYDDKKGTEEYIAPEDRETTPFTVAFDDERLVHWDNARDALITGLFFHAWADQTVPIDNVDIKKMRITSKYPAEYTIASGADVYVYNLIEEIDVPGEYFVDRRKGILYVYMPQGKIDSIVYTTLEDYMFTLNDCEYVEIKGIDMSYMRSGAVKMRNTSSCSLSGCEIYHTGKLAVSVSGSNNTVYDCYVHDVEGGISMSGGDRNTLTYGNNIMENNELERCDRISKTYMQAASVSGVGNYVLNNEIHDSSHTIVGFSGNDQTIAYNEIYDAVKYADDMGAIYAGRNLTCRGNEIFYNYMHDIGGADLGSNGVQAIFLDDWFSEAEIKGNVFENVHGPAIRLAGSYNEINNNIFVNVDDVAGSLTRSYNYGHTDSEYTYREGIKAVPYMSDIWVEKYPEIVNVIDENDRLDMNNFIKATKNVLYNTEDFATSEQVAATATVEDNVIFEEDPGFVNMADRNYTLEEDAKVYEEIDGFEEVPFEKMGRYNEKAEEKAKDVYIICDGSNFVLNNGKIENKSRVESFVKNSQVYVSLRAGIEALGGTVSYDEATEKIQANAVDFVLEFTNGDAEAVTFDSQEYKLSSGIININNTNYISLSDLADLFGCRVVTDGEISVISSKSDLFDLDADSKLLRYLKEQITIY